MGQPKLVLPWNSTSIIGHLLEVWESVRAQQITVVCPPFPHAIHGELDRLKFPASSRIINPAPEDGMFSSIRAAARWTSWNPMFTHFALALGDQPQIPSSVLQALLEHAALHPDQVSQPSLHGRARHPVIFPRAVFRDLASTTETTLRNFLERSVSKRSLIEIPNESLALDLDTPEEYQLAFAGCS